MSETHHHTPLKGPIFEVIRRRLETDWMIWILAQVVSNTLALVYMPLRPRMTI